MEYLSGGRTYLSVAMGNRIFAPTTVRYRVMMNINHEEILDSRPEKLIDMVKDKSRKTTL